MAPDETIDRPAGKTAGTKDKLRALILHPATPEAERRSALRRLEVLLARDGAGKPQAGLEITRSSRIGHRRRPMPIDEFMRLEPYVAGIAYGEVVRDLVTVCRDGRYHPGGIDFGFHPKGEAVVAVRFAAGAWPDPMTFQTGIRRRWPKARVNRTSENGPGGERTLLVYLGVGAGETGNGEAGE